ncbi:hypothetical protein [Halorarum halobium]|uniref:hypothetical protein n=1 Tax=Halorarum halobium TaxID=3075121 RepID=UPI0028A9DCFC|nr:hypothetical protein [Halobaculum sp. XH14]
MPRKERPWSKNVLNQLAGVTGLGWTMSILGFLGTLIGYGNAFVTRLVAGPQSLLYIGTAFFVATLGLDRLTDLLSETEG